MRLFKFRTIKTIEESNKTISYIEELKADLRTRMLEYISENS